MERDKLQLQHLINILDVVKKKKKKKKKKILIILIILKKINKIFIIIKI